MMNPLMNPLWKRELNIAQVDFEMMILDLQREWQGEQDGEDIHDQGNGQPPGTEQEVPVVPQQYP